MTARDHFREAEKLIEQADAWMDADLGWKASLSARERIERRQADLFAAITHALLGLGEALDSGTAVPLLDLPMRTDLPKETS
ncbi:hypothetical protein E1264_17835 [Actinomadura sp. KC216]|uniref:hypothetical protein n=1 Tax=Actinomadura sp. KC216 TaxID=2530370 RepID=UPI00104BEC0E|nr:hypothetical protein [Actinomadura sp. KC216]TDB86459.1 hypothetical protein E1264_17835 [Actinomadura sp. KC216]